MVREAQSNCGDAVIRLRAEKRLGLIWRTMNNSGILTDKCRLGYVVRRLYP